MGPHILSRPLRPPTADETRLGILCRTHRVSSDAAPLVEELTFDPDLTDVHDIARISTDQGPAFEHGVEPPDGILPTLLPKLALTLFRSRRMTIRRFYDYHIPTHGQSEKCGRRAPPPCLGMNVAAITGASKSHRNR